MEQVIITKAEWIFCNYKRNATNNFFTALINAIMKADTDNRNKLRLSFPELVEVVYRYQTESGYGEELENKFESRGADFKIV